MKQKLSPELRRRLADSSIAPPGESAHRTVDLAIEVLGDLAPLEALGFKVRSVLENREQGYKIVTGTIAVARLNELAALPQVVTMEGPRRMRPQLNYSLDEVQARVVQNGTPHRKGQGVLVGLIDSGLDWRHGSFVNSEGTSRIVALWDQQLQANLADGEVAGPGGLGVVYRTPRINDALQGRARVRSLDPNDGSETIGHGTHVMGIAAGNGLPASCCTTPGTYVGVAPEANLVAVRYRSYDLDEGVGENIHVIDAITFILDEADAPPARGVAINISLGDNMGPHDGTAAVERAIDAGVSGRVGRAIVVAAGNFSQDQCHVRGTVPGNDQVEIEFNTREKFEDSEATLDLWYDRGGRLQLELLVDGGTSSGTVAHGDDHFYPINPGASADERVRVNLDSTINGPYNRDHNVRITLLKPNSGNIPAKKWTLKLTESDGIPTGFHCWIERGDYPPIFLPEVNPPDGKIRSTQAFTLSTPSTAKGAITVANHASKTDCCDCWPKDGIVSSSSHGPVAKGADQNHKPDIAAPGLLITAPKSDAANLKGNCCDCCPDACCCLYKDMTGTSMAAPHVTGAIALMLEANPMLNKDQILQYLQASARPPPPGGPPEIWGAGKLNVAGAVQRVLDAMGGGGGGGTPMRFEQPRAENPMPFDEADALPPAIRIVRARLGALAEGERVASALSRHFSEVRRLVNTNRRVATLWHRGQGPRMLRRLIHGAVDPQALAPISSGDEKAYLSRFCDLLARYGSARLQASLKRYRETVLELLRIPLAARVAEMEAR